MMKRQEGNLFLAIIEKEGVETSDIQHHIQEKAMDPDKEEKLNCQKVYEKALLFRLPLLRKPPACRNMGMN